MKKIILFTLFIALLSYQAIAEQVYIDMSIISKIESSNNPFAYNSKTKAIGLYQITPICLKDYNLYHIEKTKSWQLLDPKTNYKIAVWYFNIRIPELLRYYKKEINIVNILISYNAGISYVVYNKKLKKETIKYIGKYFLLRGLDK
jgi:soluble lytic murein transglycosylase-like protein